MRDRCADYWEDIVNLAEGKPADGARQHLEACPECTEKLRQIQQVMALGDLRFFDAPAKLIKTAQKLLPTRERTVMGLLRSTTAWSGARTVSEDFQIVVGAPGTQVRLMYTRSGEHWEVLGKAPGPDWLVNTGDRAVDVDREGRFSFKVASLGDTGFTLSGADGELVVPSVEELLSNGPSNGD
jgi:hypothetical protein